MPLEAGSVFVRIAGLFDSSEFSKADRAVAAQRASAKDPIVYKAEFDDKAALAEAAKYRAEVAAVAGGSGASGGGGRGGVPNVPGMAAAGRGGGGGGYSAPVDHRHGWGGALAPSQPTGQHTADWHHSAGAKGSHGLLGNVGRSLWTKGGPFGMGGFSLGSMIGLGPEHLLGTGVSVAGSLVPAMAGGGLAAGGAAATALVGGGSDALVMHQTRTEVTALSAAYDKLQLAQATYGKNSTQAARATAQLNGQIRNLIMQGLSPDAAKAVSQTAALEQHVKSMWTKDSSPAQVKAAGVLDQAGGVVEAFIPKVTSAATKNLGILDQDIKPLFAWLKGPQGMGIFDQLEDDFAKKMPTSIHMMTQAVELTLRVFTLAANQGGKMTATLDKFFSKGNAESTAELGTEVDKLLGSFHDWAALLSSIGKLIFGIVHSGAGEGQKLVVQLTTLIDKFAAWEKSAKGSSNLHTFFTQRASELEAILKTIGPVLGMFLHFYSSVQILVPVVTLFFNVVGSILHVVETLANHSKLFNDMFVVPLGAFLLSWKLFSLETTIGWVKKLGAAILVLTGIREKDVAVQTEQDLSGSGGGLSGAASVARRGVGGILGQIPIIGGRLQKMVGGGGSNGGGMGGLYPGGGPMGSRRNPMVVVDESSKLKDSVPGGTTTAEKDVAGDAGVAAGDAQGVIPGLEKDVAGVAPQGVLPGLERGAVSSTAADVAPAVETTAGVGIIDGLKAAGPAIMAAIPEALPAVAVAAAIGGAIYAGIKIFGGSGPTEAQKAAAHSTRAFGSAGAATNKTVASLLGQAATAETPVSMGGPRGSSLTITPPSAAEMAKASALYAKAGQDLETQLQAGWSQYAHIDETTMFGQFMTTFEGQKTKVQAAGAEAAVAYADGLEKDGKLPAGAAQQMLAQIEAQFPALIPILGDNAKKISVTVVQMVNGMKTSLSGLITGPNSFADLSATVTDKSLTITQKWGNAMAQLTTDTSSAMSSTRSAANTSLQGMVQDFIKTLPAIPAAMEAQGAAGKAAIVANIKTAIQTVQLQMAEGVVSIKKGESEILKLNDALNASAKATRAEAATINTLGTVASHSGTGTTGAGATPRGVAGIGVQSHAGGGILPGKEYGYSDQMTLVDPAGRPRAKMAGDESVYTRYQRPFVDMGLQAIGFAQGSKDLWQQVNRPHGFAQGGAMNFAGGGFIQLPPPTSTTGSLNFTTQRSAAAPGIKSPTPRKAPTVTAKHSPTLSSTIAGKLGLTGVTDVDNKVGALDTKYTNQDNLFMLYDGASGNLPTKDLQVLMGIRDEQFGLLWNEWKILPKALKSLDKTVYGTSANPNKGPSSSNPRTGGIDQTVSTLSNGVTAIENEIVDLQNNMAVSARNVQLAKQGTTQAALNAAAANAASLTGTSNSLNNIHTNALVITQEIAKLQASANSAGVGTNTGAILNKIAVLKKQRAALVASAVPVSAKLHTQAQTNRMNAIALRQQNYNAAWAAAAAKYDLATSLRNLRVTLTALKKALANELKVSANDNTAIANLRTRLYGDASGTNSLPQELSDYGYDILDLQQQGATIHPGRLSEIEKVFKSLGEVIPAGMGTAAANTTATAAFTSLQGFEAAITQSLLQFGSNFVAAGANPFGTQAAKLAGVTNYGSAGGAASTQTGRAQGGALPPPPPTPYGGKGDTNINITQHFARGPSDAHSYSNGLKWELGAAF